MPKEILIIKHIEIEGPGSIEEFFRNTAWSLKIIDLSKGQILLNDFDDIEGIISLGGPMNVYEEDKYSFLKDEDRFLRNALKEGIPILGICLGAQLLAKACQASIKMAQAKEIGWYKINLTDEGRRDPLFESLPRQLLVFEWHEDTFEVPKNSVLLAGSDTCPNQAFRYGRNAYGVKFHIEVTPDMVESWIEEYVKKERLEGINTDKMLIETFKRKETFARQANLIYLNFARIIEASRKVGVA